MICFCSVPSGTAVSAQFDRFISAPAAFSRIFIGMKRSPLFPALCLLSVMACRRKTPSEDLKTQLEKALSRQLDQQQSPNRPHPHFDVLGVTWSEDSTFYRCNFTVKMTMPDGKDTTGIMKKKVSRDFNTVE